MKKDTKPPTIKLPDSDRVLTVNEKGSIYDEGDETTQVTAGELDLIAARASFLRDQSKGPKAPRTLRAGHGVTFVVTENGPSDNSGKTGDVYVGCQRVPYATVMRAHKLSRAVRARKSQPAAG